MHDRTPLKACMGLHKEKIETIIWGTWDSNPGPNDSMPARPPLHQLARFVSKITSNYYIKKHITNAVKQIKRAWF